MKPAKQKHEKKHIFWLAAAVVIIVAAIVGLIFLLRSTVNRSIYSERKELLGRLTESSASVINDNISYGQTIVDTITDSAIPEMKNHADIQAYFQTVGERSGYNNQLFFFVDAAGKYYCSDGVYGKIVDATYYTDTSADKLSYIATLPHLDNEEVYLIFRNRLAEPVRITTGHGEAELLYCGILYNIDGLNNTVSREFAGENNTFLYNDTTGVMMYKSFGIKLLIDGYNIYPKFTQAGIVFDEDPAELEQACRSGETVVVALEIDGTEYYFCSASIAPQDWSVAFIVQSAYLNEVSGNNAIGRIILCVSLIAVIFGAALVVLIASLYRNLLSKKSIEKITGLNAELESATRAKSDFLSNMSHDIRTPINGIMGMTTIARGVEGNPPKTTECLEKIDGASRHLLSLINDVLDMSRIERGKTEIAARPLDIREVFDNCCGIINGQISGRELTFLTDMSCEHPYLLGDELHLRQIFINILGNAVKFTKDGGTIWFRCREQAHTDTGVTLAFEVEDTGIGMQPEFLPKIFDAFSQDEGGARSEYKGTGLGMAITKQLAELMGGQISVRSQPGEGSCFTVVLPFAFNPAPPAEEELSAAGGDIHGVKILLVEDNELNMEIAVELLTEAGAVLTTAENGQQAVEIFQGSNPGDLDAILMDVMMPVMNGLEAAKAIRALPRADAADIPILAMTANAFESDIRATEQAGMNAHLSKPIDIDEVIKITAHFVEKRRSAL